MLSHVFIGVNDFPRAFAFYSAVLAELGLVMKFREDDRPWAGWMMPDVARPLFLVGVPFDTHPAVAGNGHMVALLAKDRATVDRAHATALAHGAMCEGRPALRPEYHASYYGAYFRDADGNKLCVCCHEPE